MKRLYEKHKLSCGEHEGNRTERIRSYTLSKEINSLVHFTPIENVTSIAHNGLFSRDELEKRGLDFVYTDKKRLDGLTDYISVSISFPNYKMFFSVRKEFEKRENRSVGRWAVIIIRKEALWELDCKFFFRNAASAEFENRLDERWSSAEAFEEMFGNKKDRINIPEFYTTNPQAEVMIKDEVPRNYIAGVALENLDARCLVSPSIDTPIEVMKELFGPREDYIHWKQQHN